MTSRIYTAIGLMSGTSMDGIDVALIHTDGQYYIDVPYEAMTFTYDSQTRERIKQCIATGGDHKPLEENLTGLHAQAVQNFLKTHQLDSKTIDLVGFHGHTILHAPDQGRTLQIGDGKQLALALGIEVINDFRSNDIKHGGQGAPLVPVYHQALFHHLDRPLVVVNIGGVANVTYIGSDGELIACDTGPGNALLDDWMQLHTGKLYDENGAYAAKGNIQEAVLKQLLAHDYFKQTSPKSLDRNAFSLQPLSGLSVEDGAATLTAFTAQTIATAQTLFKVQPKQWIISGGGRKNHTLMSQLKEILNAPVLSAEEVGYRGDSMEAEAFAYLAVRSLLGLPLSYPGTTGVKKPVNGGVHHHFTQF